MFWETKKFIWLALLQYLLYCGGLEQYLHGMPALELTLGNRLHHLFNTEPPRGSGFPGLKGQPNSICKNTKFLSVTLLNKNTNTHVVNFLFLFKRDWLPKTHFWLSLYLTETATFYQRLSCKSSILEINSTI